MGFVMKQLPARVNIERELFEDRCRITVWPRGAGRGAEVQVFTDLTVAEAMQVLDDLGILRNPFLE